MTGEERREKVLEAVKNADSPLSGTALAKMFGVSRQIIVQDIALLKVSNPEIYATPKGYMCSSEQQEIKKTEEVTSEKSSNLHERVFHVIHDDDHIEDELNLMVDIGGEILDVYVKHEVYGSIKVDLNIKCRRHVNEFMEKIKSGQSTPLCHLTSGEHYHTVIADSEETLNMIENGLAERGYLVK